jgi:hypothetical protein
MKSKRGQIEGNHKKENIWLMGKIPCKKAPKVQIPGEKGLLSGGQQNLMNFFKAKSDFPRKTSPRA